MSLLKKNDYGCIWHLGPFAIGETFSLLALFRPKNIRFIIGPVYTPFPYTGKTDFGLFGKKAFEKTSPLLLIKNRIDREIYQIFAKLFKSLSVATMKKASKMLVIEHEGKKRLEKLGISGVEILMLGIDKKKFPTIVKKVKKTIDIVTIGYFVPRKRTQDTIEALAILIQKYKKKNLHLTIVGDGSEKEHLINLAKGKNVTEYVSFPGYVPRSTLAKYYRQADIFISASPVDSMPGVYFEAMAVGMPLVLAKNYSSDDLAENGFGGFVVSPNNPAAMADKLAILIADSKLREKLGRKNQEVLDTYYNLDKNIARLVSLFKGETR